MLQRLGRVRLLLVCLAVSLALGLVVVIPNTASAKVKIVVASHYGQGQKEYLLPYFEEYMKLHPDVEITYQEITFADYLQTVMTSRVAGKAPDIYHLYSLWGVQMVGNGALDRPPASIQKMVRQSFVPSSVEAVTMNGQIWGIPTEIDNYMLVYNKRLLKEAGFNGPPRTWDELLKIAKACTKRNAEGKIVQAGFALERGWDSAVVHPWMALLYAQGGSLFSKDFSRATFNGPQGVKALEQEVALFKEGATDPTVSVWDFPTGTIAMTIMAPWYKSTLQKAMKDRFTDVGVAPIPAGPAGNKSVQYTFYWAVDSKSKVKKEAWAFLQWLNEQHPGQSSPMGNFLTKLGAIPSGKNDIAAHKAELGDAFMEPFVNALKYSVPEPNVVQGQEIKTSLMNHILEAFYQKVTPKQALDAAAKEINAILAENH